MTKLKRLLGRCDLCWRRSTLGLDFDEVTNVGITSRVQREACAKHADHIWEFDIA